MEEYKSLNKETGLIEDKDEIRLAGIRMSEVIYALLAEPAMALLVSPDTQFLLAAAAVSNESRMRTMSQAEIVRKLASLSGNPISQMFAEIQIRKYGLSETLPDTHPDAPRPEKMDRMDQQRGPSFHLDEPIQFPSQANYDPFHEIGLPPAPRSPFAQTDYMADALGKLEDGAGKSQAELAELPGNIESFLRGLLDDKEEKPEESGEQ